jgi:hypothetical protein
MNTIEKVLELLRNLHLPHRVNGQIVTVDPSHPNGFAVSLEIRDGTFVVFVDGWHEHFDSDNQAANEKGALDCFKYCLTGSCRLKVYRRGKTEYRWVLESQTEQGWQEDSSTGLLLFPFWKRLEIIYRENFYSRAADSTA